MNMFRFTGQPVDGVRQRPFLMPRQLEVNQSRPCFIMQPPLPQPVPPPSQSLPLPQPLPVPVPSSHIIGAIPVNFVMSTPPPSETPVCLFAPVAPAPASFGENPSYTQWKPDNAYSVPASTSDWSTLSAFGSTNSSQMNQHSSFKLNSSSSMFTEAKDNASEQYGANGNKRHYPKRSSGSMAATEAKCTANKQSAADRYRAQSEPQPNPWAASESLTPSMPFDIHAFRSKASSSAYSSTSHSSVLSSSSGDVISTSATIDKVSPPTVSIKTPVCAVTTTMHISSVVSNLNVSAPVFTVQDSADRYDCGDGTVWNPMLEPAAILHSTASLPDNAKSSPTAIGRGRKLMHALPSRPGAGDSYELCLHALLLSVLCRCKLLKYKPTFCLWARVLVRVRRVRVSVNFSLSITVIMLYCTICSNYFAGWLVLECLLCFMHAIVYRVSICTWVALSVKSVVATI